jgi:hypothetical protein
MGSYWARAVAGGGLMLIGLGVTAFAVYKLTQTGTCASGGPYVSARPCPDDTVLYGISIFPAVIAFLLGGWIFATRGRMRGVKPGLPPHPQNRS